MLWRSQRTNIYHICQRCGVRQPLTMMRWQNGLLVCGPSGCIDTAIVGSRDLNVARQIAVYRHELEPDQKLTNPIERKNDQFEVLY
jgi:hypothetical protein